MDWSEELKTLRERRIEKLQVRMAEAGLDVALVMTPVNLYYLAGTAQKAVLLIPSEGEPRLYVFRSWERAKEEAAFKCIEADGLNHVVEELEELKPKLIGLEEDTIPVRVYKRFLKVGAEVGDVAYLVMELRQVKDHLEIELLRRAAEQCDKALSSVKDVLKEGVSEVEVAARLELELRKAGHDGYLDMRSWGDHMPNIVVLSPSSLKPSRLSSVSVGPGLSSACPVGSGGRRLKRGDVVWIDVSGRFQGYTSDVTRTFVLGKADKRVEEAFNAVHEIYRRALSKVRAGVKGSEVYMEAVKTAEELGYGEGFMGREKGKVAFIGHGVGLEIDEPPVIGKLPGELSENMTVAIEPKIVFPRYWGVGLESTLVVRSGGYEVLDKAPLDLVEV